MDGWVTVCGQVNHLHIKLTPRWTQPPIPLEYLNWVPACLAGVDARHIHLCRVAGNTAWSHMAGDASYLWDGFPVMSLTLPPGWTGSYTCPVLRPYQLGPMRIPECNHKVTGSGYKAVDGCEAETSTKALVTWSNLLSRVWSALSQLLTSRL